MKLALVIIQLVLLSTTAFAGPKEKAFQVLEQWTKAFSASDVDAIVKLHASDALFLGTSSKTVVTRTEDIRKGQKGSSPLLAIDTRFTIQ